MKIFYLVAILVWTLALMGCNGESVRDLPQLLGMTESEVHAKLGQPNSSDDLTLEQGKTLPEMYIEIHNTYHPNDPSTAGVVIRENRWDASSHTKVVFFHQVDGEWIALQAFRFDDGVQF